MSLFKSGIILAFFTVISRIFGLVRELLFAQVFGVSSLSDSINVAFKLPNLFRRILGEGALSSVFIPIFNLKQNSSLSDAKKFTGEIFTILFLVLLILVIIMEIFMPSLMWIIAPGFHNDPEKFKLTVLLCRITLPYLAFISLTAFLGAILNANKKFASFAFVPVILNIVVIGGTIIKIPAITQGKTVAWSLVVAGIVQLIFMYIFLIKEHLSFPIFRKPRDKDIKTFMSNMVPATLSAGVIQLNLFISQIIASFIPGAISILGYSERIYQFPLSIIGITFGTILLPELSKIYSKNDEKAGLELQNKSIMVGILLSFAAMVGIVVLARPIIHLVYERGAFNADDTIQTADTLVAFAFGLPAFIFCKILTPIFFAKQDFKTPLKITIYVIIINTILNIIFMKLYGYIGIAIGSTLAAWVNFWLLYAYSKRYGFVLQNIVYKFGIRVVVSCLMMAVVLLYISKYYGNYFYHDSVLVKIIMLSISITLGAVTFAVMCLLLKLPNYILNNRKHSYYR